jgi:hypothetical protein
VLSTVSIPSAEPPLVSVVIPAFNLARFLPAAIDSVLGQVDPGGAIQITVVDDGSTDDTGAVLDRYRDRVQAIRQPNAGLTAAVVRGLAEVRGEFVALLDADDEWPPDRLARHVSTLRAHPSVGLVHGDMEIIDAHGAVASPSFMAQYAEPPVDGRVLGQLIRRNFVTTSAITFRASLLPAILPMGPETAYPDWRISACVAAVAEIRRDAGLAGRYRSHGENMSFNRGIERELQLQRGELPWRRWMMSHLAGDDSVTLADRMAMLQAWHQALVAATLGADEPVRMILPGPPGPGPCAARTISEELLHRFVDDPLDGATALELEVALVREARTAPAPGPPSPPLIELDTRARVTLASLEQVIARPGLLEAFARETSARGDETVVVLAPSEADVQPLVELVECSSLLSADECDIRVLTTPSTTPAWRLLGARAHASLDEDPALTGGPVLGLPRHPAAERLAHDRPRAPLARS